MKKKRYSADDIQVLEVRDVIRKRPAMYMGSTKILGFLNILKGFFSNDYPVIDAQHYSIEITGNTSGKILFQNLKTPVPSTINEHLYHISYEFAILNALCKNYEFTLFNESENEILKQIFEKGILKSGSVEEKNFVADSLEIKFDLDTSIWEDFSICPYIVAETLKEAAFLNNDKTFELKFLENNQPCRIFYHFENGLRDLLKIEEMTAYGVTLFSTWIDKKFESFSAEIGFAFSTNFYNQPFFKSFVNNYYTYEGGQHTDAMISGITNALKRYIKKYCYEDKFQFDEQTQLSNNFVVSKNIVSKYLIGVIRLKIQQPRFSNGYKTKLENAEIGKPLSDFISKTFFQTLENDREKAIDLIKHFHAVFWKKTY